MAEVPKLSPMKEEFIRGSDMVSLMRGDWQKLYQIKKENAPTVAKKKKGLLLLAVVGP